MVKKTGLATCHFLLSVAVFSSRIERIERGRDNAIDIFMHHFNEMDFLLTVRLFQPRTRHVNKAVLPKATVTLVGERSVSIEGVSCCCCC